MTLKETFKKQGGMKLLKQYWVNGALFTAVGELLLLGKSKTALEILRLATQLKTVQKLEKRYHKTLEEFDKNYNITLPHEHSNKVWICWFQGMEKAPIIVQKCYKSIRKNMPDKEIIVLTNDNLNDYVELPNFIMDKWRRGIITHTHMTDLLRLELLIKYGGMWIDATVFCSGKEIPAFYFDSDLFFYQCLKPGRNGHVLKVSSWLMSARTNNKLLMAIRALCYEYWKEHNNMVDYFLLHDFMGIVLDYYPDEWNRIVPKDNALPHVLLLRLFNQYDDEMYEAIIDQSPFHKLSYKFTEEQMAIEGTYYKKLFGNI